MVCTDTHTVLYQLVYQDIHTYALTELYFGGDELVVSKKELIVAPKVLGGKILLTIYVVSPLHFEKL